MKTTFKATTLAILVGLGVTACKSTKPAETPTSKAPITGTPSTEVPKPEKPTAETPTTEVPKPEKPATETPTVEAPKPEKPATETPTAEVPKPEKPATETPTVEAPKPEKPATETPTAEVPKPEKPATETPTAEVPKPEKPTTETPTVEAPKPEKPTTETPTTEVPEPEKPVTEPNKPAPIVSIDSKGHQWRIVKMNGQYGGESKQVYTQNTQTNPTILNTVYSKDCSNGIYCSGNALENSGINSTTIFNLDELAQKDGKPLLGLHSGSYTNNDFSGTVVKAYLNDKGQLVTSTEDAKTVNYLFVNQPYSSYGVLFTNENDIAYFELGRTAATGMNISDFDIPYQDEIINGQKTGRIIWNDNVKGNATYKGQVIASIATYQPPAFERLSTEPKIDGTITLNANFGDNWEKTYLSGELDSKTIGKVAIPQTNTTSDFYNYAVVRKQMNEVGYNLSGKYNSNFHGKDLNDITGTITITNDDKQPVKGNLMEYNAVFGATKQPK